MEELCTTSEVFLWARGDVYERNTEMNTNEFKFFFGDYYDYCSLKFCDSPEKAAQVV